MTETSYDYVIMGGSARSVLGILAEHAVVPAAGGQDADSSVGPLDEDLEPQRVS